MAPPRRDRSITPVATEHSAAGQGEERRQRVALAVVLAKIGYLSQDRDQRTGLWYHGGSSIQAFWLICGRALPGNPSCGSKRFIPPLLYLVNYFIEN
jgi:hypothetical protein